MCADLQNLQDSTPGPITSQRAQLEGENMTKHLQNHFRLPFAAVFKVKVHAKEDAAKRHKKH